MSKVEISGSSATLRGSLGVLRERPPSVKIERDPSATPDDYAFALSFAKANPDLEDVWGNVTARDLVAYVRRFEPSAHRARPREARPRSTARRVSRARSSGGSDDDPHEHELAALARLMTEAP